MTQYWVEFDYNMVESSTEGPDATNASPVTFLGVPWFTRGNGGTENWTATFPGGDPTPSPYSTYPWGFNAFAYADAIKGSWGTNGNFTESGVDYFNYTISIGSYFVVASQPAPTVLDGPILTETVHDDLEKSDVVVSWTEYAWAKVSITLPATLTVTPPSQSQTVPLAWNQSTGGVVATAMSGQVQYTDSGTSSLPSIAITGVPTITAVNVAGNPVNLTSSQTALLQTAFTISPAAGNTVDSGTIDWNFSYQGAPSDLDFLAGKTVTVTDTIQVTDQNGNSGTAQVTDTLSLPPYAGIDYRYQSANDPLAPSLSAIKSSGIGFVGEYIGGVSTSSYLTLAKAKQYNAAGLGVVALYEKAAMGDSAGYSAATYFNSPNAFANGKSDAEHAIAAAKRDGQANGSAIYFGIDYNPGTNLSGIVTYFQGVDAAFAESINSKTDYQVGVYGAGNTLSTIKDTDDLAAYSWLAESTGWAGSKIYTNWNIEQVLDPSLIGSTNFPSTSDFTQFTYIAGDLTNGQPTGASTAVNTTAAQVAGDLAGAGTADVVWFDPSNANVGYWAFNGSSAQWTGLGAGSTTMQAAGIGDFTGNGTSDILWENPTNGIVGDWLMNNGTPTWQQIGQGSTTMNIAGVGDFYGDGTSDILWQNPTNNLVGEWQMNNNVPSWQLIGQGSTTMNIAGVGDFNGDGTSDILWENPTNNLVGMWGMNGSTPIWSLIDQGSTTMKIVGVGDFTGTGIDDILWENPSNGVMGFWGMANGQDTSWNVVGTASTTYQVAGIGDYYGNGTDDILWRNATTGDVGIWAMNNGQAIWHDLGMSSTSFNTVKA